MATEVHITFSTKDQECQQVERFVLRRLPAALAERQKWGRRL